jgi:hypothetical protein
LQFVRKVSARSFLRATCTCGTLSPSDLWDPNLWGLSPCPSDLWDTTACVSLVLVDPSPSDLWDPTTSFSISIQPVGPDDLCVTCTYETIRPLGPDNLCVTCTCGTFLHLHLTHGARWLACHLLPSGFNKFKLKKTMRPGSRTRDSEQGIDRLHHCARRLVVLTCLWSSICSLCRQVDLYIGYIPIPCKWKQIYAR